MASQECRSMFVGTQCIVSEELLSEVIIGSYEWEL